MSVHVLNEDHTAPAAPGHWQRAPPGHSLHSDRLCTVVSALCRLTCERCLHMDHSSASSHSAPHCSFPTATQSSPRFLSSTLSRDFMLRQLPFLPSVPLKTFQFCTSETLKIANADLRPGVGFDVICASYITQMC